MIADVACRRWIVVPAVVAILGCGFSPRHAAAAEDAATRAPTGFGWSSGNVAGKAAGEIGGTVTSTRTPYSYAAKIEPVAAMGASAGVLEASGSIALPRQGRSKSAVFIGWFNADVKGWRFPACAGFWVSGGDEPSDVVFTYALSGDWHRAQGAKPTTFKIPRDGSRHTWTIRFDPKASDGNGAVSFALNGQPPFVANLPPGQMRDGVSFDRFGLLQAQASSDPLTLWLDDVQIGVKTLEFAADPVWVKAGGDSRAPNFVSAERPHANTAIPTTQLTRDSIEERIKAEPDGALSFYTRNQDNKLVKRFMITPEGSLVAGGTVTNGPDAPLTSEAPMMDATQYDNATNGARLSWINDFHFGLHKSAGLGMMQSEGQPMLNIRVLGLMGRGDSPDIQLGRAGPDNGRTNYGPLESTEPGSCLGKIIFKSYYKDPEKVEGEWTGDIAGLYARNETISSRDKSPASLHFTTAGASATSATSWRENIDRMVIRSNGYVAIGDDFSQPAERLHVRGNVRAEGDVIASGAKKFVIDHPTQPGKQLQHAAIEGPESAVYYRGEAKLTNGRAVIPLPEYFEALTAKHGRTVLLTNLDGFDRLAVQRQSGVQVKDGHFVVISDNPASTQAFTWEVKATRADVSPLAVTVGP